jgi:hypothetical protein
MDKVENISDSMKLIYMIEGYAQSARRTADAGKDPAQTLGRIRSQINRWFELNGARR